MPTYNGAGYLADAVESVWRQTLPADEIVVVDDFSSDDTAGLAEQLSRRSPVSMRVIRLSKNSGGPGYPINVGIAATRTKFIAVLDQDDVFESHRLEEHSTALNDDPTLAFAASSAARFGDSECLMPAAVLTEFGRWGRPSAVGMRLDGQQLLYNLLVKNNFFKGYPAFTFRRSDWMRRSGVDATLRIASDYEFLCWLCLQGDAVFMPQPGYLRREHQQNLSRINKYVVDGFLDRFRVLTRYIPRCPALRGRVADRNYLQNEYATFAYWVKRAGFYGASAKLNLLALRVWGINSFALTELAKTVPQMMIGHLTGIGRDEPFWSPGAPGTFSGLGEKQLKSTRPGRRP
jgi:glycosyltransferase involved in cell wall biosynthesis